MGAAAVIVQSFDPATCLSRMTGASQNTACGSSFFISDAEAAKLPHNLPVSVFNGLYGRALPAATATCMEKAATPFSITCAATADRRICLPSLLGSASKMGILCEED